MKIVTVKARQASSKERLPRVVPYYLGHILIYLGFLLIALVVIWLVFQANRIYASYQAATHHVAALEAMVSAGQPLFMLSFSEEGHNPAQLEAVIHGLATELAALHQASTPFLPLTPFLGWLPVYGGDLQASPHLLAAARDLSRAGAILFDSLRPALWAEPGAAQHGTLPHLVARLAQAQAELAQAEALLQQAQADLNQLEMERLSPSLAQRAGQLKQYLPPAISGVQRARNLPFLLGAHSPQTYLILTQNSDELRPSGGYINAAGHIIFDRGQIIEFVMQDSYAVDRLSEKYPYPPDPLYHYMAADYWVLRDAGWSPDFPTTARTAIDLYQLGQGISANGVIAFDQQALPFLLQALGPVEVEGEWVTSGNVVKLMRQHWQPEQGQTLNKEWWQQRKSFMLALAETIRQKFEQDFGAVNLPILVDVWQQALAEKHILIYLADPGWSDFLAQKNWAGSLQTAEGDYLMVVDANVGFNKANPLVERHTIYRVTLAGDGSAQAQVNLLYQHHARNRPDWCRPEISYEPVYEQNMERCYWNYLQLIVPAQAQLSSGPKVVVDGSSLLRGQPTSGEIGVSALAANRVSWGQLFLLAPGERISLDYIYALPSGTARLAGDQWEYHLYLQKQPGTLAPSVELMVTLPEGATLLNSRPQPLSQQGQVINFLVNLKADRVIDLSYTLP